MNSDLPLYQPNGRRIGGNGQPGPGGLLLGIDSRSSVLVKGLLLTHLGSCLLFRPVLHGIPLGKAIRVSHSQSYLETGLQRQQDRQETSHLHWSYRSCDIGIALVRALDKCLYPQWSLHYILVHDSGPMS
jgi:hypothetical protein